MTIAANLGSVHVSGSLVTPLGPLGVSDEAIERSDWCG
jgi:hypothetical protein